MVKIVTDTTASLTLEQCNQYGIISVPLYICESDAAKKELYELSYDDFYQRQRTGSKFTTSQPDPNAFLSVFGPILECGDEIICITLSSGISGTINSATVAQQMSGSDQISIIDSLQSGFGQAALCIKAAIMAASGASRHQIVAAIEPMRYRTKVYFVVESLRYLYEGGRLNGAQALIGSMIQIKPIIWFDSTGKMTTFEKIRTLKAAKNRVLEIIKDQLALGIEQIGLHYGDNLDEAVEYGKMIEALTSISVPLIKLSPVIAAHTGPDILGPCIITKPS